MAICQHVAWWSFMRLLPVAPTLLFVNALSFKPNFKCSPKKLVGGRLAPIVMCANEPQWISSACEDLRGHVVSWKSPLEWVNVSAYNFLVSVPTFTNFSPNMVWNVVDEVLFRFSLRWFNLEIFAIKFERLSKIEINFGRFLSSQIL